MRIVCEQCHTKYVYPDEKIVKNKIRFQCQKCGHEIIMSARADERGGDDSSSSSLGKWNATGLNTPRRASGESPSWYYSYNGESHGPLTESDLTAKFTSPEMEEIAQYCYVWRKTFAEWKPVMEVEPFASAILMPPPPPVPPAPPRASNSELPPLLTERRSSRSSSGLAPAVRTSSPDLQGLKRRLNRMDSQGDAEMPDRQRESLSRLASTSSPGLVSPVQDLIPTNPAFPAAFEALADVSHDDKQAAKADEQPEEDTTRVGVQSPFVSFKALNAIPSEPGKSNLPSISRAASGAVKRSPSSSQIPAFGGSAKPQPGIASIFANANASANASNTRVQAPAAGPRFAGLQKIAKSSASHPAVPAAASKIGENALDASDLSAKVPVNAQDNRDDMPDFKDDIGHIVDDNEAVKRPAPNAERDESVSSWLPSQSELPPAESSQIPGLSATDFKLSPSVVNCDDAKKDVPTIELDNITLDHSSPNIEPLDMEHSNDVSIDELDLEKSDASMDLPEIAMDDEDEHIAVSGLPEIALLSPNLPANEEDAGNVTDLNLEDDDDGQAPTPSGIAEIDLDEDEASQIFSKSTIDDIEQPRKSGIVSGENLFGDDLNQEQQAVARVSHAKLDEIAARREALLAEIEAAGPSPEDESENESGVSENSQLIQLAHFEKVAKQDSNKKRLQLLIAIAAVIVAVAAIAFLIGQSASSRGPIIGTVDNNFGQVQGRTISSEELDRLIPEDDFEIFDASGQGTARSHRSRTKNTAAPQNINDAAIEAIYGSQEDDDPTKPTNELPAVRKDGRASVVLQRADDFASTAGVQGSKYQNLNGAPSDRDRFTLGLKSVSATVQECHRREAKTGNMNVAKVYLQITVEPTGSVNTFKVEEQNVPQTFSKCLQAKKDRWKFAPFDGAPVTLRQGFVLD